MRVDRSKYHLPSESKYIWLCLLEEKLKRKKEKKIKFRLIFVGKKFKFFLNFHFFSSLISLQINKGFTWFCCASVQNSRQNVHLREEGLAFSWSSQRAVAFASTKIWCDCMQKTLDLLAETGQIYCKIMHVASCCFENIPFRVKEFRFESFLNSEQPILLVNLISSLRNTKPWFEF